MPSQDLLSKGFKDRSLGQCRRDTPTASAVAESLYLAVFAHFEFLLFAKDIQIARFTLNLLEVDSLDFDQGIDLRLRGGGKTGSERAFGSEWMGRESVGARPLLLPSETAAEGHSCHSC